MSFRNPVDWNGIDPALRDAKKQHANLSLKHSCYDTIPEDVRPSYVANARGTWAVGLEVRSYGAMRLKSMQRWLQGQTKSPLVRAARGIRTNELDERLDRRGLAGALPGLQSWLILVSVLFDVAWLGAWLLVATRYHAPIAIVLASFPVLKWLLLLVARHTGDDGPAEQSASLVAPAQSCVFRPSSPAGGRSEFQLETDRPTREPVLAPGQAGEPEQDFPPEAMRVLSNPDPLVQPMA